MMKMILSLISKTKMLLIGLRKSCTGMFDLFRLRGVVTATLRYAGGPNKGEVHSVHSGKNIVTSWIATTGPTSGRDVMRRLLVPPSFSAETLSGVLDAWVGQMALGSGVTAETVADVGIETQMTPAVIAPVTAVALDPINPYVTFTCNFSEAEANGTISEAVLLSGPARNDVIARKTFTPFTKTAEFTLQLRWQLRF